MFPYVSGFLIRVVLEVSVFPDGPACRDSAETSASLVGGASWGTAAATASLAVSARVVLPV